MNYRSITIFLLGVLATLALTHNYSEAENLPHSEVIRNPPGYPYTCFGIYNGRNQLVGGNCIVD